MSDKLHIIYPYRIPADGYFGWELKLSMRSLYKNLKGDFDVTIIGDIPDWINQDEVRCIELDNHDLEIQRQSKINQKILKATELYDEFLVMNDDIYVMFKLSQKEIKTPRFVVADLHYPDRQFTVPNSFHAQMKNSYFKLTVLGRQAYKNFVSHTPHFYETEKIKEIQKVIDLAPSDFPSVVFENVYHNYFSEQGLPVGGYRWGCWHRNCPKPQKEKIINHDEGGSGRNPWLKGYLESKFKEKCRGEK